MVPSATPRVAVPTTPYIGSRISLISKSAIRYVGILYTIDTKASTVALKDVKSFGTEGRPRAAGQVSVSDQLYPYIIFRGPDILDLEFLPAPSDEHRVSSFIPSNSTGCSSSRMSSVKTNDSGSSVPSADSAFRFGAVLCTPTLSQEYSPQEDISALPECAHGKPSIRQEQEHCLASRANHGATNQDGSRSVSDEVDLKSTNIDQGRHLEPSVYLQKGKQRASIYTTMPILNTMYGSSPERKEEDASLTGSCVSRVPRREEDVNICSTGPAPRSWGPPPVAKLMESAPPAPPAAMKSGITFAANTVPHPPATSSRHISAAEEMYELHRKASARYHAQQVGDGVRPRERVLVSRSLKYFESNRGSNRNKGRNRGSCSHRVGLVVPNEDYNFEVMQRRLEACNISSHEYPTVAPGYDREKSFFDDLIQDKDVRGNRNAAQQRAIDLETFGETGARPNFGRKSRSRGKHNVSGRGRLRDVHSKQDAESRTGRVPSHVDGGSGSKQNVSDRKEFSREQVDEPKVAIV